MSDEWQVPKDTLEGIMGQLKALSSDLAAVEPSAEGIVGVDDVHGEKMTEAVDGFFKDWKGSRTALISSISVMGDVSGAISGQVSVFDDENAAKLKREAEDLWGMAHAKPEKKSEGEPEEEP